MNGKDKIMNNFILDEMMAKEHRKELYAEVQNHNIAAKFMKRSNSLRIYNFLANLGTKIENLGTKLEEHYNCLATREKRHLLINEAK